MCMCVYSVEDWFNVYLGCLQYVSRGTNVLVQLRGQFVYVQEKLKFIDLWARDYCLPTYTHVSHLFMCVFVTVGSMTFQASNCVYVNGFVCMRESHHETKVETVIFA